MSKRGKWADEVGTVNRGNDSDNPQKSVVPSVNIPPAPPMAQLNVRIPLELRMRAVIKAKAERVNLSDVVAKFLEEWVKE